MEDPGRESAFDIISKLDHVPKELLTCREAAGDSPQKQICAICQNQLDQACAYTAEDPNIAWLDERAQNLNLKLELLVFSPCRHLFHSSCLFLSLTYKTTCPTCRRKVNPAPRTIEAGGTHSHCSFPSNESFEDWVGVEDISRDNDGLYFSFGLSQDLATICVQRIQLSPRMA